MENKDPSGNQLIEREAESSLLSPTDGLYRDLYRLLDQLIKTYRLLLDTVRREKDLLIAVDIKELNENNKTKETAIRKLRSLEDDRVQLSRALAKELSLREEPIRLLDLATRLGGARGDELRSKHSVLDLLIRRVQEFNQKNEVLAQAAIKNVTGAIDSIRDSVKDRPTYERKGEVKTGNQAAGHLVSRQV